MINLANIKMLKSGYCLVFLWENTFAFEFKDNYLGHEEDIILYCEDRSENLIEGLVHELTEMTIKKLLIEFINVDSRMYKDIYVGYITFKIYHLATVLSLPYYGVQLEWIKEYESMLKDKKVETNES